MTPAAFCAKWHAADGSERANYQLFFNDLCELLEVEKPQPAHADDARNAYVFERYLDARDDASVGTARFIDTYKRGHFICEAKSFALGKQAESAERKLIKAKAQAESYARNLPEAEPRPPLLMVVNVGRFIALYAQFKDNDRAYEMYPDRASYRIALADLADDAMRQRLRLAFTDPTALNPERIAKRVTRAVANALGALARELEVQHPPQAVAGFLTRCLFTMFAEDVGLLPAGGFTQLLARAQATPASLAPNLEDLWRAMDGGAYSLALQAEVAHFNGKLFKTPQALALTAPQIAHLLDAAKQDWKHVEPAIFGTLIERALDPVERHALGAHFTPRGYVERLVLPSVIEPLRRDWADIQTAAIALDDAGEHKSAVQLVHEFQVRLAQLRVLDPACGSGNFLYIALEHLKRLEGDVLEQLAAFNVSATLDTAGLAVDPHQFLGIERNPHAAAIAELVLWIGYLQWHFRTRGQGQPPRPILRDFKNIECRDAVLDWAAIEPVLDASGAPLTRWDGSTCKPHPVTGKAVPDDAARVPVVRYRDPRPAAWPAADVIIGNPPFIGAASMRAALGDGYVEALRAAYPAVPESADLVMFWWHCAARLLAGAKIARFGFITTNSLTQTFNRRVLEAHLGQIHLTYAIADHPWVDSADGAAVRVAMTVAAPGAGAGRLLRVVNEAPGSEGEVAVELVEQVGQIHADLRMGANVAGAVPLRANVGLSSPGLKLHGAGFIVTPEEAAKLASPLVRPYRNGRDLTDKPRGVQLIDTWGQDEVSLLREQPAVWQWLHDRVKPERDAKAHTPDGAGYAKKWWLHGKPRPELRKMLANLPRYIATVETAKHRVFQFLDATIAPDNMLVCIALDDAYALGVLSSRVHVVWALAAGGRLGVGNDPRYNKTRCFEPFPFPAATPEQRARIADLAERLDAQRKRQQAAHPALTLTGLYNVLEQLRAGTPLSAKEQAIHEQGLVSVLKTLHDELDAAVLDAYGWGDLAPAAHADEAQLLLRLTALNAERAAAEASGSVRWLRPALQNVASNQALALAPVAADADSDANANADAGAAAAHAAAAPQAQAAWPVGLPAQLGELARVLGAARAPLSMAELAACFAAPRPTKKLLASHVAALAVLGRAHLHPDGRASAG